MKPIQAEIRRDLEILSEDPRITRKARGTARDLLCQLGSLWAYVYREGVSPTNNAAELAVRKAVLWRKVSLGVESESGPRFVERMLTLAGTARRRRIDLMEWLTQAVQANLQGQPAPAFLA